MARRAWVRRHDVFRSRRATGAGTGGDVRRRLGDGQRRRAADSATTRPRRHRVRPGRRGRGGRRDGWNQLAALADEGWEVGSHTIAHQHLPTLSDAELEEELRGSRLQLEAALGSPCRSLAYPYGEVDARVEQAAGEARSTRWRAWWRARQSAWPARLAARRPVVPGWLARFPAEGRETGASLARHTARVAARGARPPHPRPLATREIEPLGREQAVARDDLRAEVARGQDLGLESGAGPAGPRARRCDCTGVWKSASPWGSSTRRISRSAFQVGDTSRRGCKGPSRSGRPAGRAPSRPSRASRGARGGRSRGSRRSRRARLRRLMQRLRPDVQRARRPASSSGRRSKTRQRKRWRSYEPHAGQ